MSESAVETLLDNESEQRVRAEQVAVLFRFPTRLLGNLINSGLVVAVVWGIVPAPVLLTWIALFVAVVMLRLWLSLAFRRHSSPPKNLENWVRGYLLGASVTGLMWGAASAIVWLASEIAYQVFVAFVIAGTSAASTVMSMPHLPSARAFLIFSVGPLGLSFLAAGGAMHLAMGAMCVLYIVLLLEQAKVSNAVFMESLWLREKNRALVTDLTAARDTLEERVRDRTQDLARSNAALHGEVEAHRQTGEKLHQAQKMEAIGRLTGGIAHDFNNLLAVVLGNAEILLRRSNAKPQEKQLQNILRAGKRGAELTQRLLAFSRRQALRPEPVDVKALVGSFSRLLDRTLGDAVEVRVQACEEAAISFVDPVQLESAILNLALNARDAMGGSGVVSIEIRNTRLEGAKSTGDAPVFGDFVLLTVSDTGVGIAPQHLELVYEPFFTTKDVGQGSGLGLSMVHGFVNQSGGQVDIVSRPGEGTTVKLYLPCSEAEPTPAEAPAPSDGARGSGKILVVEDDKEVRSLVTGYLTDKGYEVIECESAAEALAALDSPPLPDLILADVMLPKGFNGPALVTEARKRHGPLRALFMTGYAATAFDGKDTLYDAEQILRKPFELGELARKVDVAMKEDGDAWPA